MNSRWVGEWLDGENERDNIPTCRDEHGRRDAEDSLQRKERLLSNLPICISSLVRNIT